VGHAKVIQGPQISSHKWQRADRKVPHGNMLLDNAQARSSVGLIIITSNVSRQYL